MSVCVLACMQLWSCAQTERFHFLTDRSTAERSTDRQDGYREEGDTEREIEAAQLGPLLPSRILGLVKVTLRLTMDL